MSGRYTLEQNGNEYTLSRSGNGEVIESEGVVTLNLTSEGHSAEKNCLRSFRDSSVIWHM